MIRVFGSRISYYTGKPEDEHGEVAEHGEEAEEEEEHGEESASMTPGFGDHTSYAFQMEYLNGDWSLRSELGIHDEKNLQEVEVFYVELARMLGENWQLAVRLDTVDTTLDANFLPAAAAAKETLKDRPFEDVAELRKNFVDRRE